MLRSKDAMTNYDDALLVTDDGVMEQNNLPGLFGEANIDALLQQLPNAISNLNTEQRLCINLFYLKEKCYEEISMQTGYSLKQVKSYIQNGKRNLKIYLSQQMKENEKHNKNIF